MKPIVVHTAKPVREHHIHPNAIVEVVIKEGGTSGWIACSDGEKYDFSDDPSSVIVAWTAELASANRSNDAFARELLHEMQRWAPNLVGEFPNDYDDEDFGK